jgi:hypothetical protein
MQLCTCTQCATSLCSAPGQIEQKRFFVDLSSLFDVQLVMGHAQADVLYATQNATLDHSHLQRSALEQATASILARSLYQSPCKNLHTTIPFLCVYLYKQIDAVLETAIGFALCVFGVVSGAGKLLPVRGTAGGGKSIDNKEALPDFAQFNHRAQALRKRIAAIKRTTVSKAA